MCPASAEEATRQIPVPPQAAAAHLDAASAAEKQSDRWAALAALNKARDAAPDDPTVCFRLAYHLDLVGEQDEALSLLEQAVAEGAAPVNALINLAIMYEDDNDFVKAERCLKLVLDTDPNHARARLYMKDVQASRSMFYDEDFAKLRDKHGSLLETPVTDFELSVRARNCLKKMNIRSLGDLLRVSEAELMAYKNFGETTLMEIKAMLSSNNLRLGQALEQQRRAAREEVYEQLKDAASSEAIGTLEKPVDELELSVRARKALELLNINTIGDLVARTEAELLGIKNFGQTSLDEIKEKLTSMGLGLRRLDNGD